MKIWCVLLLRTTHLAVGCSLRFAKSIDLATIFDALRSIRYDGFLVIDVPGRGLAAMARTARHGVFALYETRYGWGT
jgi:sugar phosphate isomerase/epimerase